jgi:hypothetical protein
MRQHIFELTKSEQRVVVLMVLLLLAGAVANHYWQTWSHTGHVQVESGTTPTATPAMDEK